MTIADLLPEFVVVPARPFLIGTPEEALSGLARRYGGARESYREEAPRHRLTLPAFALARVPVTNALYAAFAAATDIRPPLAWRGPTPPADRRDHPVVDVSWEEAVAFCAWLSAAWPMVGARRPHSALPVAPVFRLPSEAEWEHAARGDDGRTFPWGDDFDPACANTRETGVATTIPVGQAARGASPYGLLDMAGNVWEWTATLDRLYPYDPDDGREQIPAAGRRILRGGCYANPQGFARCACRFRLPPTVRNEFIGFRLACTIAATAGSAD